MSPLYDYRCNCCDYRKEVFKPIAKSDEVELCPQCEIPMPLQPACGSFQIKGSSFANGYQ